MADSNDGMIPQDTPPSFIPSGSRKRVPSASAGNTAPTVPPSYAPGTRRTGSRPAATPDDAAPASIPPASHAPRRSSGSTRTVGAPGAAPIGSETSLEARPGRTARPPRSIRQELPTGIASASRTAVRPRRRHSVRTIIAAILAMLIIALGAGAFGAWNWVDSRLNKEDWLSPMNGTDGTAWLVLGSDERDGSVGGSADDIPGFRTDTILVLTKPKKGPSSLISIPRDSLTQVDGQYMKLNAVAMLASPKALVEQVEHITGHKIDHVAKIKFGGLKDVVDALGGIELCYDQNVNDARSELNWQAGCHMADGATALAFSRMRYSDSNGDFGRNERQRQVIGAIMRKGLSKSTLTNFSTVRRVADTALAAVSVDENTNPWTLAQMAFAFRDAMGDKGVNGSVYWSNPDYTVSGVGSTVLLDDSRNAELFGELAKGTHSPGTVGTLAEMQR